MQCASKEVFVASGPAECLTDWTAVPSYADGQFRWTVQTGYSANRYSVESVQKAGGHRNVSREKMLKYCQKCGEFIHTDQVDEWEQDKYIVFARQLRIYYIKNGKEVSTDIFFEELIRTC